VQPLWKAVRRFLKKLKTELPYDSVIQLLSIYPKECKSGYNRDTCTLIFIIALIPNSQAMETPRCPTTDEWIEKFALITSFMGLSGISVEFYHMYFLCLLR
jgi:hypothetical protein